MIQAFEKWQKSEKIPERTKFFEGFELALPIVHCNIPSALSNLATKVLINMMSDFINLNTGIAYLAVDGLSLKA